MGYSFIDLETTGLDHETDQIIEVAIINTDDRVEKELSSISFLVKLSDERTLSPTITKLTGITEDMLKTKGLPYEVMADLVRRMTKGRTIVAQFASFDLGFLKDIIQPDTFYCTRTISYITNPNENPGLSHTCKRLRIKHKRKHWAYYDALAVKDLFKYYLTTIGMNGITIFKNKLADTDKRPLPYIPKNAIILNFKTKEV